MVKIFCLIVIVYKKIHGKLLHFSIMIKLKEIEPNEGLPEKIY